MRPIKPSVKRSSIWRWLWDASHQAADTVEQGFQTSCLLSLSLLNHHHSSQLYDSSHDISPVRAAAYAPPADSDNESGSQPFNSHSHLMRLFHVIKPSLPCCCVKRHLNCQLGLGDVSLGPLFLSYLLFQQCGQLNFSWLQSARRSLLDWGFWHCCDSAVCPNVIQLKLSCLYIHTVWLNWLLVIFRMKEQLFVFCASGISFWLW